VEPAEPTTTKASGHHRSEDEDSFTRTREIPNLSFLRKIYIFS